MTSRTSKKAALKECIKYVLEDLWDAEEEEPFCKIFKREFVNGKEMQKILQHSKAHLRDLSCRENDDAFHYLQKHELGDVHKLVRYQFYLI